MSNLQIGLAAAGLLVLVLMGAHTVWNSRKNQPRQASPDGPETEPHLDADLEPELNAAAFEVANFPLPTHEKRAPMDALIDVIAPIALDAPLSGEAVLAVVPSTRRVGSKPFSIEGLNEASRQWEVPQVGQRYVALQAGVQRANRSGALNDIEYSEFVMKTQSFCDALNATPNFPDMREEVARARELDRFAGNHDAQLGFLLRARNAAWSPRYVQQNALRFGFVAGPVPGRMILPASQPGLPAVLSLSFDAQAAVADDLALSAIREIAFNLEVSQVSRSERAFVRMRETALALAETMEGVVTDDNGLALLPEAMDVIQTELEDLYDRLDQHELPAGSALARRLFS